MITDGQLFFGNGEHKKMNIWIQDDKIISIHPDIRPKPDMKTINAQGYAVFPGMICEASFAAYTRNPLRYHDRMLHLVNNGFTSFIDVIRWNQNKSTYELISEAKTFHISSPIDFTFHLSIPIDHFTPSLIHEVSRLDIRQITLETNDIKYFSRYDWEAIFTLARKYGVTLKLYPHISYAKSKYGKKTVAEIANYWYYLNKKYGRTSLFAELSQYSSYRHIENVSYSTTIIKDLVLSPAKYAGIYPQKGSITVGSDADLVFIPIETIKKKMSLIPHFIFVKGDFHLLPLKERLVFNGVQLQTIHTGA